MAYLGDEQSRLSNDRREDPLIGALWHDAHMPVARAIAAEVATFLSTHADLVADAGRRCPTPNEFLPERISH